MQGDVDHIPETTCYPPHYCWMHIQNIICHFGSSVSIAMAITGFIINLIVSLCLRLKGIIKWCVSDVCLTTSVCLSIAYIMNIYGAHSYWKQGTGRRRRKACMGWSWAAACGVQGRGILCGLAHSLLFHVSWRSWAVTWRAGFCSVQFDNLVLGLFYLNTEE